MYSLGVSHSSGAAERANALIRPVAGNCNQPETITMSPSVALVERITSEQAIEYEHAYSANNYHPLPVVLARGEGPLVYDPEGNCYLDFLSAYSAVNQGHCHPKIIQALTEQASKLTLSSRAFYNDVFPVFAKFVTEFFDYETVLPMNTGAEAVETGIKMARRWGYMKKGIPLDQAIVLSCSNNFHGRTLAIVSMSTDPDCKEGMLSYKESGISYDIQVLGRSYHVSGLPAQSASQQSDTDVLRILNWHSKHTVPA